VVRLKGGDPSLFGRLSEEVEALFEHELPFRVLPGIPWICTAPLRHGIYLTERRHIRHFQVATGTEIEGKAFECQDLDPEKGPVYFFMAIRKIPEISAALLQKGYDSETPCAALNENGGEENIVRGTLANISERMKNSELKPPALFIVGDAVRSDRGFSKPKRPLKGIRVLTTGTDSTRDALGQQLSDLGATPVHLKTFDLEPDLQSAKTWVPLVSKSQWILLSSASAVAVFLDVLKRFGVDLRSLPKLGVSGPAAANALVKAGLVADFLPEIYTSEALAEGLIESEDLKGQQVLIPRSSASTSPLPTMLQDAGATVKTATLYSNRALSVTALPKFDAACFCSPSSVKVLQHLQHEFSGKTIASIGPVTTKALKQNQWPVDIEPKVYNAKNLAWALASKLFLGD
jgi:uroporphyrinogen III methyltransferase/synthase